MGGLCGQHESTPLPRLTRAVAPGMPIAKRDLRAKPIFDHDEDRGPHLPLMGGHADVTAGTHGLSWSAQCPNPPPRAAGKSDTTSDRAWKVLSRSRRFHSAPEAPSPLRSAGALHGEHVGREYLRWWLDCGHSRDRPYCRLLLPDARLRERWRLTLFRCVFLGSALKYTYQRSRGSTPTCSEGRRGPVWLLPQAADLLLPAVRDGARRCEGPSLSK